MQELHYEMYHKPGLIVLQWQTKEATTTTIYHHMRLVERNRNSRNIISCKLELNVLVYYCWTKQFSILLPLAMMQYSMDMQKRSVT